MSTEQEQWAWIDEWAGRIAASGFAPVVLSLLEIARAFGVLGSQALLVAQPLLTGIVAETTVEQTMTLLESPQLLERLEMQLAAKER